MRNLYRSNETTLEMLMRLFRIKYFRIITVIVALSITLLIGFIVTSNTTHALSSKEKKVISIEVKSGDTLWSIANEYADEEIYDDYNEFIDEVKDINNISSDYLRVGGMLIIPYYE